MASPASLTFSCTCGTLRGSLSLANRRAETHAICHCADCRAAQLHFGQPDPAPGGVQIFQTTPDAVTFTAGLDRLGLMRLGPKGLMRWYAICCNAPLFNTLASPKLSFVGVLVNRLEDADPLGRVVARGFIAQPGGGYRHKGAPVMVWRMLSRLAAARLSGRWRDTPFFDVETSTPVADATILTKAQRAALYPG